HAGALREQVGAAGERPFDAHAVARDRPGDAPGGHVLRDLVGVEPCHRHLADAGGLQRLRLGGADRRALAQDEVALADGVDRDAADGVAWRQRAELHAALASTFGNRSAAVIWPMIATAISAGDTAPIFSPIGAWIEAICASGIPAARIRSTRLPWVLREPSAPM